jgi:thymidine kinase
MFSGKTERLIHDLTSRAAAGKVVVAFKPLIDNRYSDSSIASHSKQTFPATAIHVETPADLGPPVTDVIGIDEVQFFGEWVVKRIQVSLRRGLDVVVSGLDLTYLDTPFGVMPELLCYADDVVKLRAICAKCGDPATRSFRTSTTVGPILIGGAEAYEPRCLACFEKA